MEVVRAADVCFFLCIIWMTCIGTVLTTLTTISTTTAAPVLVGDCAGKPPTPTEWCNNTIEGEAECKTDKCRCVSGHFMATPTKCLPERDLLPQNLLTKDITSNALKITWTLADSVSGLSIVSTIKAIQANPSVTKTCHVEDNTAQCTGLTSGNIYTVKVTNTFIDNIGVETSKDDSIRQAIDPAQPGAINTNSSDLSAPNATLKWTASVGHVEYYQVTLTGQSAVVNVTSSEIILLNLEPGIYYTIKIVAHSNGRSKMLETSFTTDSTVPGTPTNVRVEPSTTETTVTLAWDAPATPNGAIKGYQICTNKKVYVDLQDEDNGCVNTTGDGTNHIHYGLSSGVYYKFMVFTMNDKFISETSDDVEERTSEAVPREIHQLSVDKGDDSFNVSWQRPVTPNGDIITYRIDWSYLTNHGRNVCTVFLKSNQSADNLNNSCNANSIDIENNQKKMAYILNDLQPNRLYTVIVTAYTKEGAGRGVSSSLQITVDNGDNTGLPLWFIIVLVIFCVTGVVLILVKVIHLLRRIMADRRRAARHREEAIPLSSDVTNVEKLKTNEDTPKMKARAADGYQHISGNFGFYPMKILGHGSHATVFKGEYGQLDPRPIAVKIVQCSNKHEAKDTQNEIVNIYKEFTDLKEVREIKTMETLNKDVEFTNIIHFIDSYIDNNTSIVYLAFEIASGTLHDYIEPLNQSWRDSLTVENVVRGIVNGVKYTHEHKLVHRDLKPANIFIVAQSKGVLKAVIGDFGSAKAATTGSMATLTGKTGSIGYIAPEIWKIWEEDIESLCSRFDNRSDIFSLALVMYFTLSLGKHPFGENLIIAQVKFSEQQPTFQHLSCYPNSMAHEMILRHMLNIKPEERPKVEEINNHPALWSNDRIMQFFVDKSDNFETMIKADPSNDNLLEDPTLIKGGNWMNKLPVNIKTYLENYKVNRRSPKLYSGKETSIRHLLRAVRNTESHYQDYQASARAELGTFPSGHTALWLGVCPGLLMHVYDKLFP